MACRRSECRASSDQMVEVRRRITGFASAWTVSNRCVSVKSRRILESSSFSFNSLPVKGPAPSDGQQRFGLPALVLPERVKPGGNLRFRFGDIAFLADIMSQVV